MRDFRPWFAVALIGTAIPLWAQTDLAAQPAFSTSPESLRDAFSGIPSADHHITVLLDQITFDLDTQGLDVTRHHTIFKAWTKEGAEGWALIEQSWSPWEEERPTVRARVISANGAVRELDIKTIADAPASDDPGLVTDRRRIQVPLPAMDAGAIVEQEVVTRHTRLALGVGNQHSFYFGDNAPVVRSQVVFRAPQALPVKFRVQLLPEAKITDQTRGGVREIRLEQGPMEALKDLPPLLPSDEPRRPNVRCSTAPDWRTVAAAYANAVDQQLQGFNSADFQPQWPASATREDKIRAIVSKLNQEIRYTGLEFGEASLVPAAPGDVLQRKYGDCKDTATLAVGLLRAAGIPAQVALLVSSLGVDVDPDLPGLSWFNHAIVYVPGSPDYWLDLTDPDLRLGVISPDNQGRLSLIAKTDTERLVPTPRLGSSENRLVETREFQLAELGRAHVVETSEPQGVIDREYRGLFGGVKEDDLRENLENYVATVYGESKIRSITTGDPDDLTKPFQLRIELDDAPRGSTGRTEAAVGIFPSHIVSRLPGFFRTVPEEEDADEKEAPRTRDFAIAEPHVYEYHYKIVAPSGFRVRQLPQASQENLGPASLKLEFRKVSDTEVTGELQFVMAKNRLTATEGLALRTAVLELQQRKPLVVYFDQIGETALAMGDVRGALAAFDQLRKLHPTEALHAVQYARALLAAGAGITARAEARRAVELEPESQEAWLQLAEILKHDLVGRDLKKGMDRDGAIEAYRKGLELNPDNVEARANMAILMEHSPNGVRYGAGARTDDAISEYQKIVDKHAGLGLPQNYPVALLRASRMTELRDYLRTRPDDETNQTLGVVTEAMLNGVPAAISRARGASGVQAQQRILASAGQTLLNIRQYPAAAGLLEAAAVGAPNPAALANSIQVLRRIPAAREVPQTAQKPEDVLRLFFLHMTSPETSTLKLAQLTSVLAQDDPTFTEELLSAQWGLARTKGAAGSLPAEVVTDLALGAMQYGVEGDDEQGYVVRASAPGSTAFALFVVKEDGQYRILGGDDGYYGVGRLAMKLADEGKLDLAAGWLDRIRRNVAAGGGDDPLAGSTFARLWQLSSSSDRSSAAIRRAAAVLIGTVNSPHLAEIEPVLAQERQQAEGPIAVAIMQALDEVYFLEGRYTEAAMISAELLAQFPDSPTAVFLATRAAYASAGVAAGGALLDASLTRFSQDPAALRSLALVAMMFGDAERSGAINRRIIQTGRAIANDYNQLAWGDLMLDKADNATLETANQGMVMAGNNPNPGLMHTVAAVDIELGKAAEARTILLQRIQATGSEEPTDPDWYVFGRIAEYYGLKEDAVAMYQKLQRPRSEIGLAGTSYALAQRRLRGLQ